MEYWYLAMHGVSTTRNSGTINVVLFDFLPIQIIRYVLISAERNIHVPDDTYQ